MKNAFFSNSFAFVEFCFGKYRCTDNRSGSPRHYLATMEEGRCRLVSNEITIEAKSGEAFYIPLGLGYQSFGMAMTASGFALTASTIFRARPNIVCRNWTAMHSISSAIFLSGTIRTPQRSARCILPSAR